MSPYSAAALRWRSNVLVVLTTVASIAAGAGFLLHANLSPDVRAWLQQGYTPTYPLSAVLCLLAALASPDRTTRRTWYLFAAAQTVFLLTAAIYWLPLSFGYPIGELASDIVAGSRQILVAVAIFALVPRGDRREGRAEFALDVAIVIGAGVMLALQLWFAIPPVDLSQLIIPASTTYLVVTGGSAAVAFIALSYLAVSARGVAKPRPLMLLLYSTIPTIIADVLSALAPSRWAHLSAPIAVLCTAGIAISAWLYVRRAVSLRLVPNEATPRRHSRAPFLALAAVELVLIVEAFRLPGVVARVLVAGTAVLLALVVVRQLIALRENQALVRARALEQERFAHLVRNSSDAAILLAADGTVRFDVPVLARLLGRPSESFVGRALRDFLEEEDRPRLAAYLQRLAPGEVSVPVTLRTRAPDGEARHLEVVAANHLADEALGGYVLNLRDVTQRVLLEDRLRESQKLEGIGRLAGGVAHDFNNLLTAIISNCELLEMEQGTNGAVAEEVRDIRRAADRAADLTRQLLQFARRQIIAPRVLLVEGVLAQLERLLKRVISEQIELAIVVRDSPLRIKADPTQIDQIILNLVVNARDAMPRGGKLTITARQRVVAPNDQKTDSLISPGRYVELRVSDTGVGMSGDVQSRIFEPFYTTKGVGEGTGLGLATAYGIVRQLGGDISVESAVGRGTTFSILLPATDEPADPVALAPAAVPVSGSRGSRGTVLVAEDEPSVRSIAVRALREKGFEVLPAVDGEDAMRIARAHRGPIDFLVSDLVMPRMGGVQLATTLQSLGHVPRILFITGYAEGGELDAAGEVQGAGVLVKPFPPSTLLASIEQLAGGRASA